MFKIFRKNCYGLDIRKTWMYACIGITDYSFTSNREARLSSFSEGFREPADWPASYSCTDLCMESAGKY